MPKLHALTQLDHLLVRATAGTLAMVPIVLILMSVPQTQTHVTQMQTVQTQ